jgi:hypothetical protein
MLARNFEGNLQQLDNADTVTTIYHALRLYNSGSIIEGNLSDGKGQQIAMLAILLIVSRDV